MNAPIADGMEQEKRNGHHAEETQYTDWPGPNSSDGRYEVPVEPKDRERKDHKRTAGDDFMSDLLEAQQQLIAAQHQFLHDSDIQKLAAAQRRFIHFQTSVLDRLGVFG